MTPPTLHDLLPDVLRRSELPWRPVHDDQAPVPGPDDAWTAPLGGLELRLDVHVWEEQPPMFQLRLVNTVLGREISSWDLPTLPQAVFSAEALVRTRLDELLLDARRRLRAAA